MAKICPAATQYSNPLLEPEPWGPILLSQKEYMTATGGENDKKKAAQNSNLWLSRRNSDDMVVYTDGSQRLDKERKIIGTGAAWTIEFKDQWVGTNGLSLGTGAEIYDAEIIAPCGGLEAALSSPMAEQASEVYICTDNLNIAKEAGSVRNGSSQAAFVRFRERRSKKLAPEREKGVSPVGP